VNTWATVFLGIIAMATLVTAVLQIVLLVAGLQLVRRVTRFIEDIERDVRPILGHINSIARDASKVATLAAAQVERADQLLSNAVVRIDDLLSNLSTVVVKTLREGNALMMGIRAVMAAVQAFRDRRRRRSEDDEALFI
jgi:predicted PurR-regulated permease PerM